MSEWYSCFLATLLPFDYYQTSITEDDLIDDESCSLHVSALATRMLIIVIMFVLVHSNVGMSANTPVFFDASRINKVKEEGNKCITGFMFRCSFFCCFDSV